MIVNDHIQVNLNFKIIQEIAQGGMGNVYEAIQNGSDGFTRRVAIKILRDEFRNNQIYVDSFVHEAKLVSTLVHENIVQVYQLIHSDKNIYYIMEYIDGLSLRDLIDSYSRTEPLPVELCVYVVLQISKALDYIHNFVVDDQAIKIIHRDIRPNNILICRRGTIKISDFGLAQKEGLKVRNCVGSSAYVAPEVVNKICYSIQSDIYSLGLLFFELLTGEKSRSATDKEALQEASQGIISWQLLSQDFADGIYKVLEKCLAFEPQKRFASVKDLIDQLETVIYANGHLRLEQQFINFLQQQWED